MSWTKVGRAYRSDVLCQVTLVFGRDYVLTYHPRGGERINGRYKESRYEFWYASVMEPNIPVFEAAFAALRESYPP